MKTFHFIEAHVKRCSMHFNKFEEFIMVLMKLRPNVPHLHLTYQFDVSRPVVTRVINTWLVIMDVHLSPLISWPTHDALHKTMPQQICCFGLASRGGVRTHLECSPCPSRPTCTRASSINAIHLYKDNLSS